MRGVRRSILPRAGKTVRLGNSHGMLKINE